MALVLLSGLVSRGITRPIRRLGLATRAVAGGRGRIPDVPTTAAIEIQGLYADFAAMAAAIDRRSRYLRDFAHAVSHEFKTPLAGIRGAIELLQDHPDMAAADRVRFLTNADADADRLALLVTRLLDLARADMATPDPMPASALAPTVARIADAFRGSGMRIGVAAVPAASRVAVPAATIEAVLATLIENSVQAGASTVSIAAADAGDHVELTVRDDGPGIVPADRARLFEPFFTTRRETGGTGLGLAIARSLIEGAGGTLTLRDGDPTTFAMGLPVIPPSVPFG